MGQGQILSSDPNWGTSVSADPNWGAQTTDERPSVMADPASGLDRLIALLPTLGGAAGGIVGGIGGTVGGFGVGGVPGAVGGSALGGGGGEALRQLLNRLRGESAPSSPLEAASGIAKEGGLQAIFELGGLGMASGAGAVGRSFIENAVRPPIGLVKEFPHVMDTIVKEGLPVGRGLLGGQSGSQRAKALLRESSSKTRGLLKGAETAGTSFQPQQVAAKQIGELAQQIRTQPISGPDLRRLSELAMTYVREHGAAMTPQALKDMKQAAQALAKPVFKAQQAGGGVTADQAVGARFNEAIARGAKEALETISGIAQSEARTQSLIGATRAIKQAELRRLPLAAEGISGAAAVVGAMLQPGSGLNDTLRNGAIGWLVARGLTSPRSISRIGKTLTAAQTKELLRAFPRLADAVRRQVSVGQTAAEATPK